MDTFGALCVALEECEKEYERMFMTSRVDDVHGEEVANILVIPGSFYCFPTSKISQFMLNYCQEYSSNRNRFQPFPHNGNPYRICIRI